MADARVFVTWPMEPEVRAQATRAVENGLAALAEERPPNLVNPEAWPA